MSPTYTKELLRQRASWIRDGLDPRIARDGPDCMHPDDVLTLHELFVGLQEADLSISTLRYSRIHVAILEVSGKATRWPKRLAEECDKVVEVWTKKYGKLSDIRPRLFKPDGRLYGVCTGRELTRDALLKFWSEQDPRYMSPDRGMQHGSLGFKPGDWWINGVFAFHAGIIDLNCTDGGICANRKGAYAVVMKDNDEICTESVERFKYRCKSNDPGRFRMTAADFHSRYPIRVLRSHTLNSLWSPRSGIRYEGLHRITGWTIKPTDPTENDGSSLLWEVELVRDVTLEDDRDALEPVLKHPSAEETDDYIEYKRVRKEMLHKVREEIRTGIPATVHQTPPPLPAPEKPSVTIQSSPMSPKTETPFFVVGDYCLLRESVLPGSPESPPLTRTAFFQPPPSPRVQTGPASRPDRTTSAQPRSLTVPHNLHKSLSTIGIETKRKKTNTPKKADQTPKPPENDGNMTTKEPSARLKSAKDSKNSFAKSFTRIFSDGAHDSDTPESPFGSVFPIDHEPSSYPFDDGDDDDDDDDDDATPVPPPPPKPLLPQLDTPADSSDANPAYRQVHWGKQPGSSAATRNKKHRNASATGGGGDEPLPKSRHHRRRDRAVYEAFDREECPEPRLLLAALNEVWDDCEQPEYPDMVLEEPAVYESNSGYSGGFGEMSRSEDYLRRIPPGGIDVGRFIAQQAAVVASGGGGSGNAGRVPLNPMRRSWHGGDEDSDEHADRAHGIGRVLREMSESSAAALSSSAVAASPGSIIARRQRLSTGSSDSSVSERGGGGSGLVGARRSSLSAFDTRMPSWGLEDGARGAGRSSRRPTIVRFSGMFNRQSLQETVDEAVDEGKEAEEDRENKRKGKERGEKDKSPGKTEELEFLF